MGSNAPAVSRFTHFAISLAIVVGLATPAKATPDPVILDARASAMGGGGITFSPGASGMGVNPALLRYTDKADILAAAFILPLNKQAPIGGPGSEVHSTTISPLANLAGAIRLHPG